MVKVVRHANGPRVYLAGRRCHHATAGMFALLIPNRTVRIIALAAIIHDRKDFPFRDIDNH